MILNNSNPSSKLVAEGYFDTQIKIKNNLIFEELKKSRYVK